MSNTTAPTEAGTRQEFEFSAPSEVRDQWLHKVAEYLFQIMIAENQTVAGSAGRCAELADRIVKLLF